MNHRIESPIERVSPIGPVLLPASAGTAGVSAISLMAALFAFGRQ